jgi:adenine phosphoribosyltransferase
MPESATVDLKSYIRNIPGFPKEGVLFRDVMPIFQDPVALKAAVDGIADFAAGKNVDVVLGAEARGFILGAAVAYAIGAGFVCARKPGKLPGKTVDVEYELEYGTDRLAVHDDAIKAGMNVLVHDDLLATGGTAAAKCKLVEKLGGKVVGVAFLVELSDEFPNARERLAGYDILSLITF